MTSTNIYHDFYQIAYCSSVNPNFPNIHRGKCPSALTERKKGLYKVKEMVYVFIQSMKMKELFDRYFWKYGQGFCERLSRIIGGLARSCKASTGLIAQAIATQDKINFESAWMFIHRLLSDSNFQIDDSFWRCQSNMIFDCLREKHGLKNGDNIQVNVDYTTLNDDFLILCASINVAGEKDVMLYFTARNYPKRKNQMDQKKMELAFFKGLRHALSKKYIYTIVADRGFANSRLLQILEDLKFDYVLRIKENLIVEKSREIGKVYKIMPAKTHLFGQK
jgi:hypothetical protein